MGKLKLLKKKMSFNKSKKNKKIKNKSNKKLKPIFRLYSNKFIQYKKS